MLRGSLVDREKAADAVAGAVIEIEPDGPQGRCRANGSKCAPVMPSGKTTPVYRNSALEDARVAIANFRRPAHRPRCG